MHKKILLVTDKDQFKPFDYAQGVESAMVSLGGNSGNAVFQYVLQAILGNDNNELHVDDTFLHSSFDYHIANSPEYFDHINQHFDVLVFVPANTIALFARRTLLRWTGCLEKVKIPVIAVGMGAQSDYDFSTSFLDSIKDECSKFVKSILKNNGFIGTRGYFTSECLKKLGFKENSDFQTIGCPSLFLHGDDLKIETPKLSPDGLRIAFNGFTLWNMESKNFFIKKYPNSIFIDQEEFYRLLYKPQELTWKELQYLSDKNAVFLSNYLEDRVKLYGDFPAWCDDLKKYGINFSFGCRIHGNVVSLLNKIPCYIDSIDSRIRELCEYFVIPNTRFNHDFPDPHEIYEQTNYDKFNKNIVDRYATFRDFANKCGLDVKPRSDMPSFKPSFPSDEDKGFIKYQTQLCVSNQLTFKRDTGQLDKNVVFVAHEFGLYPGHGGIAAYLYNICRYLLKHTNFKVNVIASTYDKNCDLLESEKFAMFDISHGDLRKKRDDVLDICEEIQPDYVELAEFLALGLHLVLNKSNGINLQNTTIVTNNHTATKECFEWSTLQDFMFALYEQQFCSSQEKIQMQYSDYCIAPSAFLAKYVKRNYGLTNDVLVFANPFLNKLKTKEELIRDLEEKIDLEPYRDSFNITLVTRFEGRKNQIRLIEAFEKILDRHANCHLFLAGNTSVLPDTQEDYRLKAFESVNPCRRDRIHFFDFMNLKAQENLWAITDLTVMPSTFENQPMAMIEAVMRGIPVIGSKYSGMADYSADEMLFDPFDEDGLVFCLNNFLGKTEEEKMCLKTMQKKKLEVFINPELSVLPRFHLMPVANNHRQDHHKLNLSERYHD